MLAAALASPSPWMLLPFAALLLALAILPLAAPRFWHGSYHLVAVGLGVISVGYYLLVRHETGPILHVAADYLSFIALTASFYVVTSGFHIRVKGQATPAVNALYLFLGALLTNVIGTTGASMLLVRPWLRMNKYRVTGHHVVFFIFLVSNAGGCLTPIGPPLFLGFLKGIPFWWVLQHCWKVWLAGVLGLIAIFYAIDRANFFRAPRSVRDIETMHEEWRFDGLHNCLFIALLLWAVFLPFGWREALMLAAALGSWFTTREAIRQANDFSFFPIKEVAWLFLGIFSTMVPALQFLERNAPALGLHSPLQFYWCSGALSGVLDNAPTYLAFLAAAFGLDGLSLERPGDLATFVSAHGDLLRAISIGAVFFGAFTYIGNGPNFMVKAIAEHQKVETPSFGGYLLRFSLPILLPFLALIGWLFFSPSHPF